MAGAAILTYYGSTYYGYTYYGYTYYGYTYYGYTYYGACKVGRVIEWVGLGEDDPLVAMQRRTAVDQVTQILMTLGAY